MAIFLFLLIPSQEIVFNKKANFKNGQFFLNQRQREFTYFMHFLWLPLGKGLSH